jgi:hypothetical protein
MEREVEILVNGKKLPLGAFVEKLVGDTVAALVGSLKGGEDGGEIKISIRPKQG